MLKSLFFRHFSTESNFTWRLNVEQFAKYICKIPNKNSERLLRKQQKTLGGYFLCHTV